MTQKATAQLFDCSADNISLHLKNIYQSGKLAVQRIETALADGVNFTQETTLSGGYPKRLCRRAKQAGYFIRLYNERRPL